MNARATPGPRQGPSANHLLRPRPALEAQALRQPTGPRLPLGPGDRGYLECVERWGGDDTARGMFRRGLSFGGRVWVDSRS